MINEFVMAIALVGASVAVMPAQGAPAVQPAQSGIAAAGRARSAGSAPKRTRTTRRGAAIRS